MKYCKVVLLYEGGINFQFMVPSDDAKDALRFVMEEYPEVRETNIDHKLIDFSVEELDDLPIPPEDRFMLERKDDGEYLIIDNERKMVISFVFEHYHETCKLVGYDGNEIPHSLNKSDFLLEADIWLEAYYPVLKGSDEDFQG